MLKVGDKVYCYYSFGDFRKGKYYEITFLDIGDDNEIFTVGVDSGHFKGHSDTTFLYLDRDPKLEWCKDYFYDYFYDNQQLREKKLEELKKAVKS